MSEMLDYSQRYNSSADQEHVPPYKMNVKLMAGPKLQSYIRQENKLMSLHYFYMSYPRSLFPRW